MVHLLCFVQQRSQHFRIFSREIGSRLSFVHVWKSNFAFSRGRDLKQDLRNALRRQRYAGVHAAVYPRLVPSRREVGPGHGLRQQPFADAAGLLRASRRHCLRTGPALGRAEHEHGPAGAGGLAELPGPLLNALNLPLPLDPWKNISGVFIM